MSYLLDTNVLLRHADREHAMHEDVVAAIDTLTKRQERLCIFPQNVAEFWNAIRLEAKNITLVVRDLDQTN